MAENKVYLTSHPGFEKAIPEISERGFRVILGERNYTAWQAAMREPLEAVIFFIESEQKISVISGLKAARPDQRIIAILPDHKSYKQFGELCLKAGAEAVLYQPYEPKGLALIINKTGQIEEQRQKRQKG